MTPGVMGAGPRNDNPRGQAGTVGKTNSNQQHAFCIPAAVSVKPTFPDMNFLPGRVFGILLTGRRYTGKDAWIELCHSRLSDSVWKLRRLGWKVQMVEEVIATGDAGRPATIGVYYLDAETIALAGEEGQRYAAQCACNEARRRAA